MTDLRPTSPSPTSPSTAAPSTVPVSTGRTSWWRGLRAAVAAGSATPVLIALAGPNGAPLWPGASRALVDHQSAAQVTDLWIDRSAPVSGDDAASDTLTAEDLCRAA